MRGTRRSRQRETLWPALAIALFGIHQALARRWSAKAGRSVGCAEKIKTA